MFNAPVNQDLIDNGTIRPMFSHKNTHMYLYTFFKRRTTTIDTFFMVWFKDGSEQPYESFKDACQAFAYDAGTNVSDVLEVWGL